MLCIVDMLIPIPILGLALIYIVVQKPPEFMDIVQRIYGERSWADQYGFSTLLRFWRILFGSHILFFLLIYSFGPPSTVLGLERSQVVVRDAGNTEIRYDTEVSDSTSITMSPLRPGMGPGKGLYVKLNYKLPPKQFLMHLPDLIIEGKPHKIPEIIFTHTENTEWVPFFANWWWNVVEFGCHYEVIAGGWAIRKKSWDYADKCLWVIILTKDIFRNINPP